MAPTFFLLSHSKNRFAISLILLISLLLATLFFSKQSLPILSLSLSTSSQLSLINTSPLNHSNSHSQHLLSLPPPPPPPPPDNSAAGDEDDAKKLQQEKKPDKSAADDEEDAKKCDLYKGSWVRDEEGRYPLYPPGSCPFVDEAFNCQENGRRDDDYLKWRWKPDDCELPRSKF